MVQAIIICLIILQLFWIGVFALGERYEKLHRPILNGMSAFSLFGWFIQLIIYLLGQLVIMAQIFEYKAILYIINTQKDRKVEEILFDHNTENLDISIRAS